MKRSILLLIFATSGAFSDDEPPDTFVFLVAEEVERLANSRNYWPHFDPVAIPLAIYNGKRTFLFRHPDVPEGFKKAARDERPGLVYEGRHPAVTANSSADVGGTMTATLLVDEIKPGRSVTKLAGVALHEAFHVFQRERYPAWAANEADLFVYPVDDPELLALRRLETEALRRALDSSDPPEFACWAERALTLRAERFSKIDAKFAAYERGTELNEGLADYVQLRAVGQEDELIPKKGFGATDVRLRAYATGTAFALLLDRIHAEWPVSLDDDDQLNLDQALQSTLASAGGYPADRCAFTNTEIDQIKKVARNDVAAVVAWQVERRAAFDESKMWRIVVKAADGEPLWPQGFDPLNVERVQGGILHARFLRLGNDLGYVEALDAGEVDIEALTIGVGPHPLFNGVVQVSILGVVEADIAIDDDHVSLRAPGIQAEFVRASVNRSASAIVVHLKKAD